MLNKYQSQRGSKPKEYDFSYTCKLKLKSGREFRKIGTVRALHQRDAIKQVSEMYDCKDITATPNLKGKISGSDKVFGLMGREEKYIDKAN